MEMKNKKAILVWSDGIETNYTEYTSTPDKTAIEQAQDQMHKEYQEHGEANEECGAFEGDMECYFAAEDQDSCRWTIIPVLEDEVVGKNKGCFVVTNIEWDTDGDQKILDTLPKEVVLPEKFDLEDYLDKDRLLDDVSDWLSAEYGYCHSRFCLNHNKDVSNCEKVTIRLEDLFNYLAGNEDDDRVSLTYGILQKETDGDQSWLDLKTEIGTPCMDGEICEIIEEKDDYIVLQELCKKLPFRLSRKEYSIAAVPAIPLTKWSGTVQW